MQPILPAERKAILDIVVDYYAVLEYLATFLERGAHNAYPSLNNDDFIKIENYICKLEKYIDGITHFLQTDGTTPPDAQKKEELTFYVSELYITLNEYFLFCQYLEHKTTSAS